jgi:adenylylsulfate reductase subunit A
METRRDELEKWVPYGKVKPVPANLRNWLMLLDVEEGKGPISMRTEEAIQNIAKQYEGDPKAYQKKMKELESEAWEDFLDMTISQAILWAASDVEPEKKPSEIAAAEPYFIGSHSGASGAWVSGPEDIQTDKTKSDYFWGYTNMATTKGIFCAGDASGASSHKFSSGSHAEGRIAAKAAIAFIVDNNTQPNVDMAKVEELKKTILAPLDRFEEFSKKTTDPDINPEYIRPKMFMFRLQKIMDEYAGGVSSQFKTSKALLEKGLELLKALGDDAPKLGAADLHELMRCWENTHRMWQAEAHVRTILFREETRWPGYYFRSDTPSMTDDWKVFAHWKWNPNTGEWEMIKRPIHQIF